MKKILGFAMFVICHATFSNAGTIDKTDRNIVNCEGKSVITGDRYRMIDPYNRLSHCSLQTKRPGEKFTQMTFQCGEEGSNPMRKYTVACSTALLPKKPDAQAAPPPNYEPPK